MAVQYRIRHFADEKDIFTLELHFNPFINEGKQIQESEEQTYTGH